MYLNVHVSWKYTFVLEKFIWDIFFSIFVPFLSCQPLCFLNFRIILKRGVGRRVRNVNLIMITTRTTTLFYLLYLSITCGLWSSRFNQSFYSFHCHPSLQRTSKITKTFGPMGQKVIFVHCDWQILIHFVGFCIFRSLPVFAIIMIDNSKTCKLLVGVEVQRPYVIERLNCQ